MEARWRGDGSAALLYPDGKVIELVVEQGLVFLKWEHFCPIRQMLADSHHSGRRRASDGICSTADPNETYHPKGELRTIHCNICSIETQTESHLDSDIGSVEWHTRIQRGIVEDDRAFLQGFMSSGKSDAKRAS